MELIAPYSKSGPQDLKFRQRLRGQISVASDIRAWNKLRSLYSEWASYPPSWTNIKTQKWHWQSEAGVVAFQPIQKILVVAGEPVGPGRATEIFGEFLSWSRSVGMRCTGYYTTADFASQGLRKVYCGTASLADLREFTLQGKRSEELRRAINQGVRSGLRVEEAVSENDKNRVRAHLKKAYEKWQGRKAFKIGFFLSEDLNNALLGEFEKWWLCWERDEIVAYLTLLPYKTASGREGCYVDQLIQNPEGHKFGLDFLLARVLENLSQRGVEQMSLGLNAFAGCRLKVGTQGFLWGLGQLEFAYNSKGLRYFKNKFGWTVEEPRYLWRAPRLSAWLSLHSIARATFAGFRPRL